MNHSSEQRVRAKAGITRCPYCHDDLSPQEPDWLDCRWCSARHHPGCWEGHCASCGGVDSIDSRAAQRRAPLVEGPARIPGEVGKLSISRAFREGLRFYRSGVFWLLLAATLVSDVITLTTFLVLCGFMWGGLWIMGLAAHRGQPLRFADLFSATERFGALTLSVPILLILGVVGTLLAIVPGLLVGAAFNYTTPLIADKRLGLRDAWGESWRLVLLGGFGAHLGLATLTTLIALPGALAGLVIPGAGILWGVLFLPLTFGTWVSAYDQVVPRRSPVSRSPGRRPPVPQKSQLQ